MGLTIKKRVLKILVDKTTGEDVQRRSTERSEDSSSNEDDGEKFVKENFHNFNFPTQKEGSFIVKVENRLADAWDECFQTL